MEVQHSAIAVAVDGNLNEQRGLPAQKKAKLFSEAVIPRDPRLRVRPGPASLSSSPDLHHKVPAGEREHRHGPNSEGEQRHGHNNSGGEDQLGLGSDDGAGVKGDAVGGDSGVKPNICSGEALLHNKEGLEKHLESLGASRHGVGVKYLVFFDIRIEEENLSGRIEFGFKDSKFDMNIEELFGQDQGSVLSQET